MYESNHTAGIHLPYTATAGSGVKVEEDRVKRQIYRGTMEAAEHCAPSPAGALDI